MKKIRVLLVDDEQAFITTLAERLEIRGFEASAASCAEDAYVVVRSKKSPDVVVLDLKMPGVDGIDAMVAIKQFDPAIEVIILTGHGSTSDGIGGMKYGAFDYIMKPVDISELIVKIKQAYDKRYRQGKNRRLENDR